MFSPKIILILYIYFVHQGAAISIRDIEIAFERALAVHFRFRDQAHSVLREHLLQDRIFVSELR